jgi:ribosomal protein L37AE/L43A
MAVTDPADDGASLGSTADDPHHCPDCGATVINGQGRYTCAECAWDGSVPTLAVAPATGTDRSFDHPVFRL